MWKMARKALISAKKLWKKYKEFLRKRTMGQMVIVGGIVGFGSILGRIIFPDIIEGIVLVIAGIVNLSFAGEAIDRI